MQKVLNAIQRVRFTKCPRYVTRVSGTTKDHRLEKYRSNLDISEVPTLQNSRIGPMKRLKDKSDVPKARLGILPKYIQAAEKWVLPSALAREPEERECAVDSGTSVHTVSEKDLHSAELETTRTLRSPMTVMSANGARCEQEKKRQCMSKNWTYLSKLCFFKKLPQCFHWGNSAKNTGTRITGKAVKIHISSKMARELVAVYQTMYHLWFLEYQRVLPQLRLHLPHYHLHHRSHHQLTEIQCRKTEMSRLQYTNGIEV